MLTATTQHIDQQKGMQMAKRSVQERGDYWHEQNEQERRHTERGRAADLQGLHELAWRERNGLDTTAQREALGLDGGR